MKKLPFLIILILTIGSLFAFTPQDDINLRNYYAIWNGTNVTANYFIGSFIGNITGSITIGNNLDYNGYDIYNATNINGTNIYQNGNLVLDSSNEANLNVNSSTFWSSVSSFTSRWFYDATNVLTFNETRLNATINSIGSDINASMKVYVDAQDLTFNNSIKSYVDAQDVIYNDSMKVYVDAEITGLSGVNKTYVDNQDIVFNDSMKSYVDLTFILQANEGNLNVNSSNYWDALNTPADITGLTSDNLASVNWTLLQNYPSACPANTYVTQIGDSITCTAISDIYLLNSGDTATGNYTFDTTTLKVDSTNNRIGIGTVDPTKVLHVIGDSRFEGDVNITGTMQLGSSVSVASNGNFEGNVIIDGNLTVLGSQINASVSNQYLNGTFFPALNNQFDIGSSTIKWANGYFAGTVFADVSGNIDASNLTSGTIPSARIADDYLLNTGDTGSGNYIFQDNLTTERIKFESDTTNHQMYDNSTCIIITGDTSTFNIC